MGFDGEDRWVGGTVGDSLLGEGISDKISFWMAQNLDLVLEGLKGGIFGKGFLEGFWKGRGNGRRG